MKRIAVNYPQHLCIGSSLTKSNRLLLKQQIPACIYMTILMGFSQITRHFPITLIILRILSTLPHWNLKTDLLLRKQLSHIAVVWVESACRAIFLQHPDMYVLPLQNSTQFVVKTRTKVLANSFTSLTPFHKLVVALRFRITGKLRYTPAAAIQAKGYTTTKLITTPN